MTNFFSTFNMYWFFYIFILFLTCIVVYGWEKFEKQGRKSLYVLMSILSLYLCCGPFYNIFVVSHELDLAKEYREYQSQVMLPIEDRYEDALIPDGFYYLGCEIVKASVDIIDDAYVYTYSFGVIDYAENNNIYVYTTNHPLNEETKYLLIMDSLNTNTPVDDQIVTVWSLV